MIRRVSDKHRRVSPVGERTSDRALPDIQVNTQTGGRQHIPPTTTVWAHHAGDYDVCMTTPIVQSLGDLCLSTRWRRVRHEQSMQQGRGVQALVYEVI